MITLNNAGKRYGHKLLFEGCNWMITPNDRVGLVGANGTGKSTLLKILGGFETLDMGDLNVTKGIDIGYLPQDGMQASGRTVFDECLSVFANLREIERELEELLHRMSDVDHTSAEYEAIADRFARLDTEFRNRDGYALEAQVGTVLAGLSFRKEDWTRPCETFSGGWQMRIALAKLLLRRPNLLLLDEPTNHLDLEARNWLEEYLTSYPNAYLLISHDRYFLDVTVKRVVELWNRQIHFFASNYSRYLVLKQERLEQLQSAARNQNDRIEQLEAFINRFRYQATKAKQVQSRIKELEKIERIELPPEERTIHFSFPQPKASGRIVAEFQGVAKSYGEKLVFSNASFFIERGDRIALVGVNGAGKSTLIKLLAGAEPLTAGSYTLGHNAQPDYFAQDQYKELDTDARLIDDIGRVAPRSGETELRNLLGCFLFSEDDVFKRIGVLSGGERNRYALARMLLQPSNFLLLDEPTNHLDMRAKDVLLKALEDYTGTVVFVSHDRYFIDRLATRVFEIGEGEVRLYPGNYEDYLWRKQGMPLDVAAPAATEAPAQPAQTAVKRANPQKLKSAEDQCAKLEQQVAALEAEIARTETGLASFVSVEETLRLTGRLDELRTSLEQAMAGWEAAQAAVEALRA
ncbi:MAG: ABC-F family ATP-binding cassette domain-containing protein [Acidobacteria bacterium]|nr:ABC-F family ATP-binding cassette domain-containing protein [Acidobacteriota bacterium]